MNRHLTDEQAAYLSQLYTGTEVPKLLTHTRPDSWERLEEDAKKGNCEYLGRSQSSCDGCYLNGKSACDEYVRIDLVRRAKALAEKEAAR